MVRQSYASRLMIRVLQLFDAAADFEALRSMDSLARGLGQGFAVEAETIGEGCTHRNIPTAAAALRRRATAAFDIVHAWGGAALTAAALGTRVPIIFSPLPTTRLAT